MIQPLAVAAADLNGDGRLDVASANRESDDLAVFFQPAGGFVDAVAADLVVGDPVSTDGPQSLACADVNGDGYPEIGFANSESLNRLFLNVGR